MTADNTESNDNCQTCRWILPEHFWEQARICREISRAGEGKFAARQELSQKFSRPALSWLGSFWTRSRWRRCPRWGRPSSGRCWRSWRRWKPDLRADLPRGENSSRIRPSHLSCRENPLKLLHVETWNFSNLNWTILNLDCLPIERVGMSRAELPSVIELTWKVDRFESPLPILSKYGLLVRYET